MNAVPIVLFWLLAVWAAFGPPRRLIYLLFCSMPFGTFAVIPPSMGGGLTLAPTPMLSLILIARLFFSRNGLGRLADVLSAQKGLLLLIFFWIVAVITTIFMPRLFAGQVTIIPMTIVERSWGDPLGPTPQNFSQLAYMTISVGSVIAFTRIFRFPSTRRILFNALIAGAATTVFTGFLDYFAQLVGASAILDPFRTATYAILANDDYGGGRRVVGLMAEASSFGALLLAYLSALYFFRRSMAPGFVKRRVVPALLILLTLLLWLSTSSSAYVGFAILCMVAGLEWIWRSIQRSGRLRAGLTTEFWIVTFVIGCTCTVLLLHPALLDPIVDKVNLLVFQKTETQSFEERSLWTTVSLQALWDSYGLGVGLGGTRASNGVVSMFSSAGILGGILYYIFVIKTFLRRPFAGDSTGRLLIPAIFFSFLPPFAVTLLAGTLPDFGIFNAFLFGLTWAIERGPASAGRAGSHLYAQRPAIDTPQTLRRSSQSKTSLGR